MTETNDAASKRVSWGWVAGCLILGAVGVSAAFFTEAHWGWVGTAPASFLQFGSAVFIAVVLFFVQRRFVREVRRETRALDERFEARTSELESRLDRLTDATAEAVAQRHLSQDATLARLSQEVSFETVTSALEEAKRLNAIDPFLFRVKATPALDGLRVEFSWVELEPSDRPAERVFRLELWSPDPETRAALSQQWLTWKPEQPAPAVGDAVVLALERAGLFRDSQTFDWGLTISELQRSLEVAIAARRADPGALRLQGRLIERVNDDWMLTDAGIECPSHSFLLSEDSFPSRPSFPARRQTLSDATAPDFQPSAPSWVSADTWAQLLRLGQLIYPIEPRSVIHDPGWRVRRRNWGSADGGARGAAS